MSQKIKTVKEYLETKKDGFYKKWSSIGALTGLSFERGYLLAKKLDEMSKLMLNCSPNMVGGLETVMFPIIVRAYHTHNYLINSCKYTLSHVISKKGLIVEFNAWFGFGIDGELEFCKLMAQEISILKL